MDQYFVLGNPIAQSKSPFIHQYFAKQCQQLMNYDKKLIAVDEFESSVNLLVRSGVCGANVTAPFKEEALKLSEQVTERAKLANAVNTLSFTDGKIIGDNTDGVGLVTDLLANNVMLSGSRILIIGAGGATRGVLLPLLEQKPASISVTNRTMSRAEQVVSAIHSDVLFATSHEQLERQSFDLVINATSAGLNGQVPQVPNSIISRDTVCYDMIYSKNVTGFNQWCLNLGATQCLDGLGMLVAQAAESFFIWRKRRPEMSGLISLLRQQL